MTITPLGFIQLGPIRMTLIHIPVIFGSLLYGWKFGTGLGFVFGLMSFIQNTMVPTPLSFAFSPLIPLPGINEGSLWALVIVFVPRILLGILPDVLNDKFKKDTLAVLIPTLMHTGLVLSLITILFKDAYSQVLNVGSDLLGKVVLTAVFTNGLAEAILGVLIIPLLYRRLKPLVLKKKPSLVK